MRQIINGHQHSGCRATYESLKEVFPWNDQRGHLHKVEVMELEYKVKVDMKLKQNTLKDMITHPEPRG